MTFLEWVALVLGCIAVVLLVFGGVILTLTTAGMLK